jgi:hypothetical protein
MKEQPDFAKYYHKTLEKKKQDEVEQLLQQNTADTQSAESLSGADARLASTSSSVAYGGREKSLVYKYMTEIKREEVPDCNIIKNMITYMCTVKGCPTTSGIHIQ